MQEVGRRAVVGRRDNSGSVDAREDQKGDNEVRRGGRGAIWWCKVSVDVHVQCLFLMGPTKAE